jgi:hypothetical protein
MEMVMRFQKKGRTVRSSPRPEDGGDAFVRDFRHRLGPVRDRDAEAFGEEFVASATSNVPVGELARDELCAEDLGGVFFDSTGEDEFDRAELF